MSGGFSKEIDSGARQMIFDNLQRYQYQYPIKSTIRELVSNGIDSIRERDIAASILSGQSKVEDHYEQREGDVYKDSGFSADYYDPAFFSSSRNVEIHYYDNGAMEKHAVVIKDPGVGLGGSRLTGYFNLGYSTKRLSKFPLGKFGLGAKSPLSTGAPFYTVTSRHNGWEYMFNIYSHKVESIIPQFDLQAGIENDAYQLPNTETIIYRRKTEKCNGVKILLQAKQHHKQNYIEAVTSQLMYFDNVVMKVHNISEGTVIDIPVKAPTIYEDDMIVMATKSHYNKPHILLSGVNYGVIDFAELELEDKVGEIGIKVSPENVSVNPSREALIWDDTTRATVVKAFNDVVSVAEDVVNRELKETDFLRWVRTCAAAGESKWSESGGSTFVGRLAKIVDLSKMELKYPLNDSIRFGYGLFAGFKARQLQLVSEREGSKLIKKVDYSPVTTFNFRENMPVILQRSATSARKNKYIVSSLYPAGAIIIELPFLREDELPVEAEDVKHSSDLVSLLDIMRERKRSEEAKKAVTMQHAKERVAAMHNYLAASSDVIWYEAIVVPDDFKAKDTDEADIEEDVVTEEAKESAAERRKLSGVTTLAVPNGDGSFTQVYLPPAAVDTWNNKEVYWGNKEDEKLLTFSLLLAVGSTVNTQSHRSEVYKQLETEYAQMQAKYPGFETHWGAQGYTNLSAFHNESDVRLIRVAQNNVKYYRDFAHIQRFYKIIRNKTITMSQALIKWNTARHIDEKIKELQFLLNFSSFSDKRYRQYRKLLDYRNQYFREKVADFDTAPLIQHLDKVTEFQLFVRTNPTDSEAIAAYAQQLFNPSKGVEITDGCAIDVELIDLLNDLLDWSANVRVMFNMIPQLCETPNTFTAEETEEIFNFMYSKQCSLD